MRRILFIGQIFFYFFINLDKYISISIVLFNFIVFSLLMSEEIKKIDADISVDILLEKYEDSSLEKTKHSIKQRLGRLLMITEIKDTALVPELKQIKNEMSHRY